MTHTTVAAVKERLDNGEELYIIDVREMGEYQDDNIGALLVPLSEIRNFEADAIEDYKENEIIIHCKSGKRSMEAAMILEQMGFKNLVNLDGGIMEWRAQLGAQNLK